MNDDPDRITVRLYTVADFPQLLRIQQESFPPPFWPELWWSEAQIAAHVQFFPAGAMCALAGGEIVGSATSTCMRFDPAHPAHTWAEVANNGWIANCDPDGDSLYGIDIAVRPAWRGHGVARALYEARFALVRRLGLARFLAGSRLSGYHLHADHMTAEAYAEAVTAGHLRDPVITPQLRVGLRPVALLRDYLPDEDSRDCALLMQWTP